MNKRLLNFPQIHVNFTKAHKALIISINLFEFKQVLHACMIITNRKKKHNNFDYNIITILHARNTHVRISMPNSNNAPKISMCFVIYQTVYT